MTATTRDGTLLSGHAQGPRSRVHLALPAAVMALLALLPLAMLAASASGVSSASIAHLAEHVLVPALGQTGVFLAGIAAFCLVVGVGTGLLVSLFQFPGRRVLSWALVLPLAVPTYISAYCYVEFLGYFGPVQTALRGLFGFRTARDYWFPDMRSMAGAIFIVGLVLYPYVYLATRAALSLQPASFLDAGRLLGCSRRRAILTIVLPVAGGAIAAGLALCLMEAMNDVGATQYLGVQTVTVAIFTTWQIRADLAAAAVMALIAVLVTAGLMTLAAGTAGQKPRAASVKLATRHVRRPLGRIAAILATVACVLPVLLGFGVPGFVLADEAWRQFAREGLSPEVRAALFNTVLLSAVAAVLVVTVVMASLIGGRLLKASLVPRLIRLARLSYAIPGAVLVIGAFPLLSGFDRIVNAALVALGQPMAGQILGGSMIAIILVYTTRFFAVAEAPCGSALASLSPNIDAAARLLGTGQTETGLRVLMPAIRPALAAAAITVFVDAVKELPATLLLRPLNVETLATVLYGHAARGSFEDGAIPALLIVLIGLVPLILLDRSVDGLSQTRRD
jgi:iron(III) transport system permease protein